ncbi:MAG TPA: hypothetical protein VMU26_14035 [Candidatus Polarisedimenticolia bacterium]|nr:hypothetical protein [Candidatus Polarisedimenticolia bacterium]
MSSGFLRFVIVLALPASLLAWGQSVPKNGGDFSSNTKPETKLPTGVILVKGAWSSASDSVTPVPEGGNVTDNIFRNQYFGMTYPLPTDWTEKYKGPPPSDSGRYVLAQIRPADTFKGPARGSILITAEDLFFTTLPAANALELTNYEKNNLQADYKLELPPTQTKIAGRPFTFYAYWSPVAELHWYVLTTQIRCHAVEMVLTSRDTKLLENLVLDMNRMKLPEGANPTNTGGGDFPVCVKNYARSENVITRVEPVFSEHKFNPVPVRIIIDKEGKVKHIHFLSAFPDQAKAITDALNQWKFKRYLRDGQPAEVETGIMFGRVAYPTGRTSGHAATE